LSLITEVLAGLPEYERKLLELRYLEHMKLEPLARALGVSLATVRRHHVAALAMVGKRMRARRFEGA
jgi:RNA polymerase sigma factor (sigma-70 family)